MMAFRQKGLRRTTCYLGSSSPTQSPTPFTACKKTSLGAMADDMGDAWDDDEFEVSRRHNSHLTKQRPFRSMATLYQPAANSIQFSPLQPRR